MHLETVTCLPMAGGFIGLSTEATPEWEALSPLELEAIKCRLEESSGSHLSCLSLRPSATGPRTVIVYLKYPIPNTLLLKEIGRFRDEIETVTERLCSIDMSRLPPTETTSDGAKSYIRQPNLPQRGMSGR